MSGKKMKQTDGKAQKESPEQLANEELEDVQGGAAFTTRSISVQRTGLSVRLSDKLGLDEAYYGHAELETPLKR